jgi:MATE family multidrug resistance protein
MRFRSELRALLLLAVPVVLSELGWMAMSIVDTIMVGRLSPAAIGAVGISSAAETSTIAIGHWPRAFTSPSGTRQSPCCWWA